VVTGAGGYTAPLELPVEYVAGGWLLAIGGDVWVEVVDVDDFWADCEDPKACVALGFVGDVHVVAEPDDSELDEGPGSGADGRTWLHFHDGDTVQVRIPCQSPDPEVEL
jgi:hypothetical protein